MSRPVSIDPEHIADIPGHAGKVLGVAVWRDEIIIACQFGVYLLWMGEGDKRTITELAAVGRVPSI